MENQLSKQKKLDLRYLRMARIWAENSYCKRRQVGALVVKDKMIISDGYNGTPSGFENICEENNVTKPYVLHAEANAITKLARSSNNSEGSTLYVTASPCIECSNPLPNERRPMMVARSLSCMAPAKISAEEAEPSLMSTTIGIFL